MRDNEWFMIWPVPMLTVKIYILSTFVFIKNFLPKSKFVSSTCHMKIERNNEKIANNY